MFSSDASVFAMTPEEQHQSSAMEEWQKTLPPDCRDSKCGHDTVDHPGYDQCGQKMYCVTCKRPLLDAGCYFCRMHAIGIKTEDCVKLLDEIIKLLKNKLMSSGVCKKHDEKTPF